MYARACGKTKIQARHMRLGRARSGSRHRGRRSYLESRSTAPLAVQYSDSNSKRALSKVEPSGDFIVRIEPIDFRLLSRMFGLLFSLVECRAPAPDLFGRQTFDVAVIELPVGASAPSKRRLHGRPWGRRCFENAQSKIQREALRREIIRSPCPVAKRKIGEQKARHADVLDDVFGASHDDGGDAVFLQHSRGQT